MGKFELSLCWKHENCMDAFFYSEIVTKDNGVRASLRGYWMTQGVFGYWPVSGYQKLNIAPKEYHNWKRYEPSGDLRV